MKKIFKKLSEKFITITRGNAEISKTREVLTSPIREVRNEGQVTGIEGDEGTMPKARKNSAPGRLASDSLVCPYCASRKFVKRGFRQKKLERVQLLLCLECNKTFTPHSVKGKHYPLSTIFDAISFYNLGYSLEESCRKVGRGTDSKSDNVGTGTAISASSLSNWLSEFKDQMPFLRMRDFAIQKYSPTNMVTTATLAHRQLYRYRFHNAKCELIMQENFHHKTFQPLREFLEMVPGECPHQYFSAENMGEDISRASESPLFFSKTAMIVRGKTNYATMIAKFVLQSVKDRRSRHEALQKFFLYNDSVTVATEVPVYLTREDIEHMQSQLGFVVTVPKLPDVESVPKGTGDENATSVGTDSKSVSNSALGLPKLITGHIDFLQIRNGMIHILDYKPKAEKEKPIEQLTLYAMALSRLTGLRLFEFKCAWFDEKDYFEFYPLHVLHKPKKAQKRKIVNTQEGTYLVNKTVERVESLRPI